jgi:hypothetical protein
MIDTLFNTKEKREAGIAKLVTLNRDPGWLLIKEILTENIKVVTDLILQGTKDKETDDLLRDRLDIYKSFLNTPENLIKQLEGPTSQEPSIDPFMTVDDLKKLRNEPI